MGFLGQLCVQSGKRIRPLRRRRLAREHSKRARLTKVFSYKTDDKASELQMATKGAGVNLTVDLISSPYFQGGLDIATRDGFGDQAAAAKYGPNNGDEVFRLAYGTMYPGRSHVHEEHGSIFNLPAPPF